MREIARRFDRIDHLGQQRREILAPLDQLGHWKTRLQRLEPFVEREAADPLAGRGNEHHAKRSFDRSPMDGHPLAARSPRRRCHAQSPLICFIEPRRARIACGIDRIGHSALGAQRLRGPLGHQGAAIGRRGKPGGAGEHPLEMRRRIAGLLGQGREREWLLRCLDCRNRAQYRALVAADIVGRAAQAGAQACPARGCAIGKEAHVFALGMPRRTARAAVNAG